MNPQPPTARARPTSSSIAVGWIAVQGAQRYKLRWRDVAAPGKKWKIKVKTAEEAAGDEDLEEARRSRQAETARADAADARNAVLSADNDELRAETRSCQEKLLQALSLLEEYQEEMTDMSSRKRTGLPSRVDALSKPRTPPVSPSRR